MPSLRAEIAELKRRMVALEARQLMWRHDAAGKPDAPDSWTAPLPAVLQAVDDLRDRCAQRGEAPTHVSCFLENGRAFAVAYLPDGDDVSVDFERPARFDAVECSLLFEDRLNVG